MSTSQKTKTVIALYDTKIQYISLAKNNYGFYVEKFDEAELIPGVIKKGEILKADFLKKVLQKIAKKINTKSVHLLFPHEYFLFDLHEITEKKRRKEKKFIKDFLLENHRKIAWVKTHDYEYDLFKKGKDSEKKSQVLFRALPHEVHVAYQHVFKKAGLKIESIHSDLLAYHHLLPKDKHITQVFLGKEHSSILEYKNACYISEKRFSLSEDELVKEIKKELNISYAEAQKIFKQYGVLRTHKDPAVLKKINRALNPLIAFLKKKKIKERPAIVVHFTEAPILGFIDKIKKNIKEDVHYISPLESDRYVFQDVLRLHKRDSYRYESLIARALEVFDK